MSVSGKIFMALCFILLPSIAPVAQTVHGRIQDKAT